MRHGAHSVQGDEGRKEMPSQQQCSVSTGKSCAAIESNEKTRLKTNGLEGLAKANGKGKDQGDRKSDFYREALGVWAMTILFLCRCYFFFFDFYIWLRWILVVSSYLACFCSCCEKVLFLSVSSGIVGKGYFGTILLVCVATAGLFLAALFLFTLPWGRRLFVF